MSRKLFLTTAFLSLILLFPFSQVSAQSPIDGVSQTEESEPVIQDVEGLRLELVQRIQDPTTMQVRFDLIVYPQITSDRVQVSWEVVGVSEVLSPKVQVLNLVAGNQYAVSLTLKPRQLGLTDIVARVEAFAADGVYLSTARKSFGSYATGEVFPVTTEYRVAQVVNLARTLAFVGVVGIMLYWLARYAYKRIQQWLKRDSVN